MKIAGWLLSKRCLISPVVRCVCAAAAAAAASRRQSTKKRMRRMLELCAHRKMASPFRVLRFYVCIWRDFIADCTAIACLRDVYPMRCVHRTACVVFVLLSDVHFSPFRSRPMRLFLHAKCDDGARRGADARASVQRTTCGDRAHTRSGSLGWTAC